MIKMTLSTSGQQKVAQALAEVRGRFTSNAQVLVGVPKGAGKYEDGLTLATVAAVNNFGTEDGTIPPRPFLAPAIDKGAPQYVRLINVMGPKVADGQMEMGTMMALLGELAQGHVQQEITDLDSPPNAASTIKAKGSSNPLIDTGALRQSIRYVVTDEPSEEGI